MKPVVYISCVYAICHEKVHFHTFVKGIKWLMQFELIAGVTMIKAAFPTQIQLMTRECFEFHIRRGQDKKKCSEKKSELDFKNVVPIAWHVR